MSIGVHLSGLLGLYTLVFFSLAFMLLSVTTAPFFVRVSLINENIWQIKQIPTTVLTIPVIFQLHQAYELLFETVKA